MGMVEKFMAGAAEIEVFDDCCLHVTEEEAERALQEIGRMAAGFFLDREGGGGAQGEPGLSKFNQINGFYA